MIADLKNIEAYTGWSNGTEKVTNNIGEIIIGAVLHVLILNFSNLLRHENDICTMKYSC